MPPFEQTQQRPVRTMRYAVTFAACVAVLVAFAAFYYFYIYRAASSAGNEAAKYSSSNTVNSVLTADNPYFTQAESLGHSSTTADQERRVSLYQQSLALAADKTQEGHIKYKEAIAMKLSGNYLGAITVLKEVGSTDAYSRYDRAYAVQTLGNIFYVYHDPAIISETFSTPPYTALQVHNDVAHTYLNLYRYAATFYPLAGTEARIADFLMNALIAGKTTNSVSNEQVGTDVAAVRDALNKVDADVARTMNDPNAKYDIPDALLRKAVVVGKLANMGYASTSEAEAAFNDADSLQVLLMGQQNPYYFIHYANYLAHQYGGTRSADIRSSLAKIYENYGSTYDSRSPIVIFLKNERGNITNSKPDLVNLALLDSGFKKFLISLGWTEKDFMTQ